MVILQRSEVGRNRALYVLTVLLALGSLGVVAMQYGRSSQSVQILLSLFAVAAVAALVIAFIQIYSLPKRSHALIIHRDEEMIVATNATHEGFKLRFLRDVLGENVFSFSDEERLRWKHLEADGYFATMLVRNVRKVLLLRLCTMVFDDVYVVDRANRWEHYDSANTSEPSFHKREMPPIRAWERS